MRKTEKNGYVRGVPKTLDDGIEIARWSTKGGAHWLSLREQVSPSVGAHWSYHGNLSGGGYTQLEGYDRQRAFAAVLHKVERAAALDGNNMVLEFNIANVDPDQAIGSMATHVDPLLIMAQRQGVPANFFADLVEKEVRRSNSLLALPPDLDERMDAMKCAGLKANILYLLRRHVRPEVLQEMITGFERVPAVTPADQAAFQLIAQLRQEAADLAFQSYDFGDAVVEAADGWESVTSNSPAGEYSRKVYIDAQEGDGPTEIVSFSVRFDGFSVVPADVTALLMSNGQEIGFMPQASGDESPAYP